MAYKAVLLVLWISLANHAKRKGSVYFAAKMPTTTAWLELPVQSLAETK